LGKNKIEQKQHPMKRLVFILVSISLGSSHLWADTLTIEQCYEKAKQNYPLIRQAELIKKSGEYSISNASKGYLPQISVNGQATYQSAVTQIPISIPGVKIPSLSKDQYKIAAEIYQPLTDLSLTKQQQEMAAANKEIQEQQLEVELYKLKDRINQLYFGILLVQEQLKQNALYKKDLQTILDRISASRENGAALKSDVDALKAELIQADQKEIQLNANLSAYTDMLAAFTGQKIDASTVFTKPATQTLSSGINRPELLLFEKQKKVYDIQYKVTGLKNIPHFGLFFQEGYGRPTLNVLDNTFGFYYITGARLSWSLNGLYTSRKKERGITQIGKDLIDNQKEVFLFNTDLNLKQQSTEVSRLQQLLGNDEEIIGLRTSVKNSSAARLENGIITSGDFIRDANKESMAREDKALHELQLLLAQYNYQTINGN
jgi:outer membrane protein TolC